MMMYPPLAFGHDDWLTAPGNNEPESHTQPSPMHYTFHNYTPQHHNPALIPPPAATPDPNNDVLHEGSNNVTASTESRLTARIAELETTIRSAMQIHHSIAEQLQSAIDANQQLTERNRALEERLRVSEGNGKEESTTAPNQSGAGELGSVKKLKNMGGINAGAGMMIKMTMESTSKRGGKGGRKKAGGANKAKESRVRSSESRKRNLPIVTEPTSASADTAASQPGGLPAVEPGPVSAGERLDAPPVKVEDEDTKMAIVPCEQPPTKRRRGKNARSSSASPMARSPAPDENLPPPESETLLEGTEANTSAASNSSYMRQTVVNFQPQPEEPPSDPGLPFAPHPLLFREGEPISRFESELAISAAVDSLVEGGAVNSTSVDMQRAAAEVMAFQMNAARDDQSFPMTHGAADRDEELKNEADCDSDVSETEREDLMMLQKELMGSNVEASSASGRSDFTLASNSSLHTMSRRLSSYARGGRSRNAAIMAATTSGEFQCRWEDCTTVFKLIEDLVEHLNDDHIGRGKSAYICQWRGCTRGVKPFTKRHKLVTHLRSHTGERPYVCPVANCGKRFSRHDSTQTHLKTHTQVRQYKCAVTGCMKSYFHARSLKKHEGLHMQGLREGETVEVDGLPEAKVEVARDDLDVAMATQAQGLHHSESQQQDEKADLRQSADAVGTGFIPSSLTAAAFQPVQMPGAGPSDTTASTTANTTTAATNRLPWLQHLDPVRFGTSEDASATDSVPQYAQPQPPAHTSPANNDSEASHQLLVMNDGSLMIVYVGQNETQPSTSPEEAQTSSNGGGMEGNS